MKKYAYNKLSFSDNMDECIVQSEADIPEAKELTLKEAQGLTDKWYDNRTYETYLKDSEGDFIKKDGVYLKITKEILPLNIASFDTIKKKEERERLHKLYGEEK